MTDCVQTERNSLEKISLLIRKAVTGYEIPTNFYNLYETLPYF